MSRRGDSTERWQRPQGIGWAVKLGSRRSSAKSLSLSRAMLAEWWPMHRRESLWGQPELLHQQGSKARWGREWTPKNRRAALADSMESAFPRPPMSSNDRGDRARRRTARRQRAAVADKQAYPPQSLETGRQEFRGREPLRRRMWPRLLVHKIADQRPAVSPRCVLGRFSKRLGMRRRIGSGCPDLWP